MNTISTLPQQKQLKCYQTLHILLLNDTYVYTHTHIYVGRRVPDGFSGWIVPTPHFIKIVVEVKAMGPTHVLQLWLEVNKGKHPEKYLCLHMYVVVYMYL